MIAFDAVSESAAVSAVSSVTWSHTCAGSDRLLSVQTGMRLIETTGAPAVSGVTYGGVAMTKVRHDVNNPGFGDLRTEIWRLVAPATGANDIVVSFASTGYDLAAANGISLTGVDQTTPVDAQAGGGGAADPATVDVTTIADNCWAVDSIFAYENGGVTVGAGQVARSNRVVSGGGIDESAGASTEGPKTPAGTITMSWGVPTANGHSQSAVAYKPATAPAAAPMGRRIYVMP